MSERMLELRYEMTPEMRREAILLASKSMTQSGGKPWGIVLQLLGGLLTALLVGLASFLLNPEWNPGVTVLIFGAGFWACLFLWQYSYKRQVDRIVQTYGYENGEPVTFRADASGLKTQSPHARSEIARDAVSDASLGADMVIIRIAAVIWPIPFKALPDGWSPDQVLGQLTEWKEAA